MAFLGIDTSNYTTSAAILENGVVTQQKMPLPVAEGTVGLRQSDAVFAHVKQLGPVLERLLEEKTANIQAVGVSISPRDEAGSYMPCFLAGAMAAKSVAAAMKIPLYEFSHQAGHIAAALFSAGRTDLFAKEFLAFHISGGTTQCLWVMPGRESPFEIQTVAQSLDLHAGQVIDRVGAMLGLPFPAGARLESLAAESKKEYRVKVAFKGLDCCLSGVENQCQKLLEAGDAHHDIARFCLLCVEYAVLQMTHLAMAAYPGLPLLYAGGVMSNRHIQNSVISRFGASVAEPAFSADNAAGIAVLSRRSYERRAAD